MSLVLDASMTIARLFDDERTEAAHAVLMRVVSDGAHVPSLWRLEIANMLRSAVRRRRLLFNCSLAASRWGARPITSNGA